MIPTPYVVYMIECSDGTLYTGIATDVERRFKEHATGKGSKYVHARGAARIAYQELLPSRAMALKRESFIKKLSRAQKLKLIYVH